MVQSQLVIIDGMMGTGKSSTADFLAEQLRRNGVEACFVPESDKQLRIKAIDRQNHTVLLDATSYTLQAERNWREFSRGVPRSSVCVLDGHLFHGGLDGLLFLDASNAEILDYLKAIFSSIAPLNPVLVHLRYSDVRQGLNQTCTERGRKWTKEQIAWKTGSPFCIARGLSGYSGFLSLYEHYQTVCNTLFKQLEIGKLVVESQDVSWRERLEQILQFLGVNFRSAFESEIGEGNIRIEAETDLVDLKPLSGLREVSGSLSIKHNPDLRTLKELVSLTDVEGTMEIWGNPSLVIASGIDNLANVGGLRIVSNSSLIDVCDFPNLRSIPGDILILRNEVLERVECAALEEIGGRLLINSNPILERTDFSSLREVGGRFELTDNPSLADIKGFCCLESIGGEIEFARNSPALSIPEFIDRLGNPIL